MSGQTVPNIILDAVNEKLEFPELKQRTLELYHAYEPDGFLIEAKAAGLPLIQELRATGIPVMDYTPSRGQDKISRVNAVSDIFANRIRLATRNQMGKKKWSSNVLHFLRGRMTTLWTPQRWR